MTSSRVALGRMAWLLALGLASMIVAASCSSPEPVNGTNTNWVSCKKDADCASVGPTAVCSAGFCKHELDGGSPADAAPSCTWPSSLDGDASSRATCHAGRAFLECGVDGGTTELCMSDDPTRCPDSLNSVPGPCHDRCHPNEYAAACGGVGPGPVPDPPAGCRSVGVIPAGIAFYCCPCGS